MPPLTRCIRGCVLSLAFLLIRVIPGWADDPGQVAVDYVLALAGNNPPAAFALLAPTETANIGFERFTEPQVEPLGNLAMATAGLTALADIRAMSSDVDGDAADVVLSIRVPQQIPASTILELYARTGDAALLQRLPMDHGVRHLQLVRVDGSWRVFRSFGSIAEALALDGDLETEPTDEL